MAKDYKDNEDIVEETIENEIPDDMPEPEVPEMEVPEMEEDPEVLNDPLADSESTEDIYSGNYRRDTSDHGIYTGGTRRDRMMSDTLGDYGEESRAERRRKQAARRRKNIFTFLFILVLAGLIAAGVWAYLNGKLPFGQFAKPAAPVETTEAETEPVATVPETTEPETQSPAELVWTKDEDTGIQKLVSDYYLALSEGNIEAMKNLLVDGAVIDEDAVTDQTTFIEGYNDIHTYVANGAQEGENAVYIEYAMKFKDIETAAPGLVPAYAKLDGNGNLRLLRYEDFDSDVNAFMGEASQSDQIKQLIDEVNQAYTAAQDSDENLKNFVASLQGNPEGTDNTAAEGESQPAEGESQPAEGESQAASQQEAGDAGNVQFTDVDDIRYVKSETQVKCRKVPVLDNDTEDFILVDAKTKVHVVGESDEWCKVYLFDGTSGYIYKKYLTILPPEQW